MKTSRTIFALLVLVALVIPQPIPVAQAASNNADSTVKLQPGDTVTVTCPTRLIPKSVAYTKVKVLCRPALNFFKAIATPTSVPTVTLTPASPATQPTELTATLQAGDTITITCTTQLIPKLQTYKKGELLCRPIAAPATATSTQPSVPTQTHTLTSTATQSANPTTTQTSMSTATQPTDPNSTATSTPTSTQISTPTATLTPSATATSGAGGLIQPYAGAPACPTHDDNQWHGIWDYVRGCHYDHTHGDDPTLADKYFGPLGKYWNGSTISYPFNSGMPEMSMKHPGYKISIRMPGYHPWPACGQFDNTDITGDHSDNCVIASRTEYHTVGGLMDLIGRYHSYWMEIYVCKPPYRQPQDCGIMRTGGLLDYAQLQAPHYNARVVRPGGTIDFGNGMTMTYNADGPDLPSHSGEPYVFSYPNTSQYINQFKNSPHSVSGTSPGSYQITIDQWSSNDFDCEPHPAGDPCHNQYTHLLVQVGDAFNLVNPQNLNNVYWICYGQPGCEYDGSMIGMNEIAIRVLQSWQSNGNGFVTFNGYSDKWGNPRFDNTCTSVSTDCVPFILDHAPVGVAASKSNHGCLCDVWEYDAYFAGKPSGWIKFPN